jgi:hypothetical protein
MKRNWIAIVALAGGLEATMFAQQPYPQQYPQQQYPQQNQGDPNYYPQNGQYPDNGQYGDPYYGDPAYNNEGMNAPAPPPPPAYAYSRPPEPGPGYYWVDGYWSFSGGRYLWVGGYWMRPPYVGAYWVAPRYNRGRYFSGFWGGARPHSVQPWGGNAYRYNAVRPDYRPSAPGHYERRGNEHRESRPGTWGRNEHHR